MPLTRKKSSLNMNTDIEQRLEALEREVEEMKKSIIKKKPNNHNRLRFWTSSVLIFISAIFFVFTLAGYWLKQNIVDTDVWVNKTSAVIQDPNVRNDISNSLTDTIFTKFDVNQYVKELLPDKAQPLADPIANSLRGLTQKQIDKILQSQAFINAWEKLNTKAHSGLVNSLEKADTNSQNSGDLLYFDDDKLMLNLQPVYAEIKDSLSTKGLSFVDKVAPAQINKQVPVATVKEMPTILLAFNLINKAGLLMFIPMLFFAVIGLLIAVDKRKSLLIFGVSSIVLLVANVQAVYLSKYPFINSFKNALQNSDSSSAQAIFSIYTKDLVYLDRVAIVLMIILVLFAYLAGPAKLSIWLRAQISKIFSSKTKSPAVQWLGKNAKYLITTLLFIAFAFTLFPIIHSAWYLLALYLAAGVLSIILLSIKFAIESKPNKKSK
jgi:hypothetical protein